MTQPRKHHYLPQFYLKGFSANGRTIYQIEKQGTRAYLVSIGDAAAIRDYHELDYQEAEDPHAIEKQLAILESDFADTLSKTLKNGLTGPEINAKLAEFVSLMRCRVPAFKRLIEESLRQNVLSTGKILERRGKLPPPPKGFEEALRMENLVISISNWKCLQVMFQLAAEPFFLNMFASMKACLIHAKGGDFFLTCDQPVVVYHPTADQTANYGVGLSDPATEVTLALSSEVLVHLSWNKDNPDARVGTSKEIDELNRRTIIMAESLVFAPTESRQALAAVTRYRQYFAGVDRQVLDAGLESLQVLRFRPVFGVDQYPKTDNPSESV